MFRITGVISAPWLTSRTKGLEDLVHAQVLVEAQLMYVEERHGVEARDAVERFFQHKHIAVYLNTWPPEISFEGDKTRLPWLSFAELDDLVRALTAGTAPEVWWSTRVAESRADSKEN